VHKLRVGWNPTDNQVCLAVSIRDVAAGIMTHHDHSGFEGGAQIDDSARAGKTEDQLPEMFLRDPVNNLLYQARGKSMPPVFRVGQRTTEFVGVIPRVISHRHRGNHAVTVHRHQLKILSLGEELRHTSDGLERMRAALIDQTE
jgi:hypothetical protein